VKPIGTVRRLLGACVVAASLFVAFGTHGSAQNLYCPAGTHQAGQYCVAGTATPSPTPSCTAPSCADGDKCWANGANTGRFCAQGAVYCRNGSFVCG
jgi:hypothetical protein